MSSSPHQLRPVLRRDGPDVLRVSFTDGGVFRLRDLEPVDPSIYDDTDRWCARVVEAVSGSHREFARLYPAGSLVDIHEAEIREVFDESADRVVYVREQAAPSI